MDAALVEALIPIVAIIGGLGFIPAIIFVLRYFRFKERELQLEADAQRWAEKNYTALEMRVQRLETVLISVDPSKAAELQSRFSALDAPARLPSGQAEGETPAGLPVKVR